MKSRENIKKNAKRNKHFSGTRQWKIKWKEINRAKYNASDVTVKIIKHTQTSKGNAFVRWSCESEREAFLTWQTNQYNK